MLGDAYVSPDFRAVEAVGLEERFTDECWWRERRGARNGGHAVVCGETGDQTDQESRSAGHRAAPSMTAMDIAIHMTFLPHDDPDASLAFYRDRPEVVPVVVLLLQAGPG